ncbi:MAG TPA: response regulator [Gemmatimonadales bacterium]
MSVLVVEDNPEVRAGLTRILTRSGFEVDQAENGLVALARIQQRSYDAVVCDIMMPVMDGIRLYQLLAHQYPEAARRVLFVSAWFDDADVRGFLERTQRPVLRKPFDIEEFLRLVRGVAAGEPSPAAGALESA